MSNFEVKRINQRLAELEKHQKLVSYIQMAIFEINEELIKIKQRLNKNDELLAKIYATKNDNNFSELNMPDQCEGKDRWLKTSQAAYVCGVSQWYLKQCRDIYPDGFLKEREHYILGVSKTAPIRWNVNAVMKTLYQRTKLNKKP
mgnify:CR=1 FL=1|tara:strand:+ start:276 stop:710 length:435 start_codon:yes stop_codon:yes gene_type:complete